MVTQQLRNHCQFNEMDQEQHEHNGRSSREKNTVVRPQSEGFEIEMPHHSQVPGVTETVHLFSFLLIHEYGCYLCLKTSTVKCMSA